MKDTDQKASMILDCAATYPNAAIWYHTSNMVLLVDSDAAYITMLEAWSFYARNFYLSDRPSPEPVKPSPKRNGPIHTECKTIRNVVSSASDAETCGTFNNGGKISACNHIVLHYTTTNQQHHSRQIIQLQKDFSVMEWNPNVQKHGILNGTGYEISR